MQIEVASGLGYPWISDKIAPMDALTESAPVGWQVPPVSRETKTGEESSP